MLSRLVLAAEAAGALTLLSCSWAGAENAIETPKNVTEIREGSNHVTELS